MVKIPSNFSLNLLRRRMIAMIMACLLVIGVVTMTQALNHGNGLEVWKYSRSISRQENQFVMDNVGCFLALLLHVS